MSRATHGHQSTSHSGIDVPPAVLLDLYGTLVEPDWAALLNARAALAERAGVPAAAAHRAWDVTHPARMTGTYGSLADDLAAVFAEASDRASPGLSARLLSHLADEERDNWSRWVRPYPDAVPALSLLRSSGTRLAIVTNASTEAASVVESLDLRPLVDGVFASCEAGILKPALLGVALRGLDAAASDATLVDNEPAQLDGAARVGIGTIHIDRSGAGGGGVTTAGHHRQVSDLRQTVRLVARSVPASQW